MLAVRGKLVLEDERGRGGGILIGQTEPGSGFAGQGVGTGGQGKGGGEEKGKEKKENRFPLAF